MTIYQVIMTTTSEPTHLLELICATQNNQLIKEYINCNIRTDDTVCTALNKSVITDNLELTKFLIEHGETCMGDILTSLLRLAFHNERTEQIKLLLNIKYCRISCNTILSGKHLLILAIEHELDDLVIYLLENGADPNLIDDTGYTPLIESVGIDNKRIVKILLKHPDIKVNAQNNKGETALMLAIWLEKQNYVKYLLKANANIMIYANNNKTAIMLAKKMGNMDIIKLLEEAENKNKVLLDIILETQNDELLKRFTDLDLTPNATINTALSKSVTTDNLRLTKYLIEKGADVDFGGGDAPIYHAIVYNKTEQFKLLLEAGANIHMVNSSNYNLVMQVTFRNNIELVKLLVTSSNINAQNNDGETALMIASNKGNIDIVKYLLEFGADKNIKNNDGKTALILAKKMLPHDMIQMNHKKIIDILQDKVITKLFDKDMKEYPNIAPRLYAKAICSSSCHVLKTIKIPRGQIVGCYKVSEANKWKKYTLDNSNGIIIEIPDCPMAYHVISEIGDNTEIFIQFDFIYDENLIKTRTMLYD